MVELRYRNAYNEVLMLLKMIPKNEYNKIPNSLIKYFEENQNIEHSFTYDMNLPLDKQNISREANTIILKLFNDYFASEKQQEKIHNYLKVNERKNEELKREKYNPNDLFKKSLTINVPKEEKIEETLENEEIRNDNMLIEYHKPFYKKIINKIIAFFKRF